MTESKGGVTWILATGLLVFAVDLTTKMVAFSYLAKPEVLIPGLLQLHYVKNPGAAFGILPNQRLFFLVVTVLALALVMGYARRFSELSLVSNLGLGLFLGGTVGNFWDRIRWGYVVDFIDFSFWPVFNVADAAIVVGVGILLIEIYGLEMEEGEDDGRNENLPGEGKGR